MKSHGAASEFSRMLFNEMTRKRGAAASGNRPNFPDRLNLELPWLKPGTDPRALLSAIV